MALLVAALLWWLPSFLQQEIPDFWLAVMILPPVMLEGYVAARQTLRPLLSGALTGLIVMSLFLSVALTTGEMWVVPIMLMFGSLSAALGAYIAVLVGRGATRE